MNLLEILGRVTWWLAYPIFWLVLNNSRRTRLLLENERGEILVVRGWLAARHEWDLPGGGLKKNEAPQAGVIREAYEEVGLALEPSQLEKLAEFSLKEHGISTNFIVYQARIKGRPKLAREKLEIAEARWVKQADLSSRNSSKIITLALQNLVKTRIV